MASSEPDQTGGDYSYDLVHEGVPDAQPRPPEPAAPSEPTDTDTDPPEAEGDYSYDLVHDFRGPGD